MNAKQLKQYYEFLNVVKEELKKRGITYYRRYTDKTKGGKGRNTKFMDLSGNGNIGLKAQAAFTTASEKFPVPGIKLSARTHNRCKRNYRHENRSFICDLSNNPHGDNLRIYAR